MVTIDDGQINKNAIRACPHAVPPVDETYGINKGGRKQPGSGTCAEIIR